MASYNAYIVLYVPTMVLYFVFCDYIIQHGRRKMFFLMGGGQSLPDANALCSQIKCPPRANFMGGSCPHCPHGSYVYVQEADATVGRREGGGK